MNTGPTAQTAKEASTPGADHVRSVKLPAIANFAKAAPVSAPRIIELTPHGFDQLGG
jgi:hypothetical protein